MHSIAVALLQIATDGANQIKGIDFCRKAAELGVDIILYPEMWKLSYSSTEKITTSIHWP